MVEPMQDLQNLINTNPIVYMLFAEMLVEVPATGKYNVDPSLQPEIRDVPTLLQVINYQIQSPISYNDSPQIGTPINAILNWPMGTKAGFAAFLRDDVNEVFRRILQYWGAFLQSPASLKTITTEHGEWLSTIAQNDPQSPGLKNFIETYICDPTHPHYGFTSWDNFFLRKYRPGLRPVSHPLDDNVIVSVAEATPFAIQTNVQLHDTFWAKGQNYSLAHLLGDEDIAKQFVGGTVYQAFLCADSYHNWHAPVTGRYIIPPKIIAGTYYSEPLLNGFDPDPSDTPIPHPDPGADSNSQGYISCVATRGVALIQASNPEIGIMAVVMIGMAEVSSVDFDDVKEFRKGDEIGRFHFGGSTHCVVFGPKVKLEFNEEAIPKPVGVEQHQGPVRVCNLLATIAD
jgi:phosphatidylserine decarboxylase